MTSWSPRLLTGSTVASKFMPEIVNVDQAASWDGPAGDAWVAREAFQNDALAAFADAAYDLVISRFGVMFFADPVAAFANLARATAPGGRLALVVWQPFANNEWVVVPRAALALGRDLPPIPEDVPGPFGLADPDRVRRILGEAGWSHVELDDVRATYDYGAEPATAAQHASEIGVFRVLLEGLDEAQTARAMDALTAAMTERATPAGGVQLDSRIWVVRAVR